MKPLRKIGGDYTISKCRLNKCASNLYLDRELCKLYCYCCSRVSYSDPQHLSAFTFRMSLDILETVRCRNVHVGEIYTEKQ